MIPRALRAAVAGLAPAAVAALLAAAPAAAQVPAGATYERAYIPTPDGERLHVQVLRPEGLPEGTRTPVVAIVSPYLGKADGSPPQRFNDLIEGARLMERGYSVVFGDTRGTGGSTGCLDIVGPGEQTDVRTVVEWAASQPWSTGRVGMYGKSYDGNLGVAGAAIRPKGLEAVVAQQVVGDRYSGAYSGGVRLAQSLLYPSVTYGTIAELDSIAADGDAEYQINGRSRSADCQAFLAGHYLPDPSSEFWRSRDFVAKGEGSQVPFLMTSGFLDNATNIGAKAIDFFGVLRGPKRLWLGWWDHVRGNDVTADGRLAMGREGWFDEVVRFYDEHLKGVKPAGGPDPGVVVQGSDGVWREERAWPPADAEPFPMPLKAGTYADDAQNLGSADSRNGAGGLVTPPGSGRGRGTWTVTAPLPHEVHLAGIPRATVDVAPVVPQTNLVVNLYDIDAEGRATMISRGARLVGAAGGAALPLYPTEWRVPAGHRIGVLISGSNMENWVHVPTRTTVAVRGGTVDLPVLRRARTQSVPGAMAPRLERYLERAPFAVPAATLAAAEDPSAVPPRAAGPPGR